MKRIIIINVFIILFNCLIYAQIMSDSLFSESGGNPYITSNEKGDFHILWDNIEDAIYFQMFDSTGNAISTQKKFEKTHASFSPRQVIHKENVVTIWWDRLDNQIHYFSNYIRANVFDLKSDSLNQNFNIIDTVETWIDAFRYTPDVCFINDTTLVAVWQGDGFQYPYPHVDKGINGRMFTTSQNFIGGHFLITDHRKEQMTHTEPRVLCHLDSDFFVVVWQDNHTGEEKIYGRYFYKDKTPKDSSFVISEGLDLFNLYYLTADININGNYVVVWSGELNSKPYIFWRWYDIEGNPNGPAIPITAESDTIASYASLDVSIGDDNKCVIVWEGGAYPNTSVYCQRFSANKKPIGKSFKISTRDDTKNQIYPSIELKNGRMFTVWEEKDKIYGNIRNFDNPTSINNETTNKVPVSIKLHQNYPNPFNNETNIEYELSEKGHVNVTMYDIKGMKVVSLVDKIQLKGNYTIHVDGSHLASGIYFYKIQTDKFSDVKKMILLR